MNRYETVIGLEVHVELKTKTKLFCGCAVAFGDPPNTHACPVCLGHPGALPVVNRQALTYALQAALALRCTVPPRTTFDRKNYFYPDSPKAYQISQFVHPIGKQGSVDVVMDDRVQTVRIHQVHLEEDAGKLMHQPYGSLVDLNRAGTPLIEIVTAPDLRSPEEAKQFLEQLREMILYCGVSDCKMEEGSLRCDANISLRPVGSSVLGTKAELKNMNSFRAVLRGLQYEVERQTAILDRGEVVVQETRRWDEAQGVTIAMRSKERAQDYRYFPDPDLVAIDLEESWIHGLRQQLPEMPATKRSRYQAEYGLSAYDVALLTATPEMAHLFEEAVQQGAEPKAVANILLSDVLAYVNAHALTLASLPLTGKQLAELMLLIAEGTISHSIAKTVLKQLIQSGGSPRDWVVSLGLAQIQDQDAIAEIVRSVVAEHPQTVEEYRQGKEKALGFLVGQVMKRSNGKASPTIANELLRTYLREVGSPSS